MKMVSMEKSKETMKDCAPVSCEHDKYPYGLRVHLDNECLEKLGIKELPKVGEKFMIEAVAMVCDVHGSQRDDGKVNKSMSLQICEMSCSQDKKSASEKLYEKE